MAKDVDLFRAAMAGVKPLKGQKPAKPAHPETEGRGILTGPGKIPRCRSGRSPRARDVKESAPTPLAFDRDVDRALSKGKRATEAKLDLHGMTLAAAERAVTTFLAEASAAESPCRPDRHRQGHAPRRRPRVRRPHPGGVSGLARAAENRARVAGVRTAHPRHGGSGAFYVLLRRRSSASSRSLRATPQR